MFGNNKLHKILIFGATSAIAVETAKLFAKDGVSFYLCARNENELKRLSGDLIVRGAKEVYYSTFDALDDGSIIKAINNCLSKFPDLDGLFIAHGLLPDQRLCEADIGELRKVLQVNFTSAAIILTHIAEYFEKRGYGTIAVISSPAGDRGRQSNYVYGAAKGALTVFLSGLRQRLHKSGVKVLTIKPGFVDTPMTAHYKKGLLFVGPHIVAKGIYKAVLKGKNVVYLPWFWWWIMLIIKNIPEKIYNKIKL
jgi:short-subunit dehydrogenase